MKGLLSTACLLALLFTMSSCEGALGKLMSAMSSGWAALKNIGNHHTTIEDIPIPGDATPEEQAAANQLEKVPGRPLSGPEKLQVVRATNLAHYHLSHPDDMAEFGTRFLGLNKQYMAKIPATQEAIEQVSKPPMQIGSLKLVTSEVVLQNRFVPEYPVAGLPVYNDAHTLRLDALYQNAKKEPVHFYVVDRGGMPEWVKNAWWYYARKGYVPQNQKTKGYRFVGTIDHLNHIWVIWSSQGRYTLQSWWDDTYQIALDGVHKTQDIALVDDMLNRAWVEKAK